MSIIYPIHTAPYTNFHDQNIALRCHTTILSAGCLTISGCDTEYFRSVSAQISGWNDAISCFSASGSKCLIDLLFCIFHTPDFFAGSFFDFSCVFCPFFRYIFSFACYICLHCIISFWSLNCLIPK